MYGVAEIMEEMLNERSRSILDKMGIQPVQDYLSMHYKPIEFKFLKKANSHRDDLFRLIFLNALSLFDYAMFIDLTGKQTILGAIRHCDRETLCLDDCMALNFYNALAQERGEFFKELKKSFKGIKGDIPKIVKAFKLDLDAECEKTEDDNFLRGN